MKIVVSAPITIGTKSAYIEAAIVDNGVTIETKSYWFNVEHFSTTYDQVNPNGATLHFGYSNSLSITNGDYTEFVYDATPQANVGALVSSVANAIATMF